MNDTLLREYAEKILEKGPTRVIVNRTGASMSPARAHRLNHKAPEIILIRDDGWSLGSPILHRHVAEMTWQGKWAGWIVLRTGGEFGRLSWDLWDLFSAQNASLKPIATPAHPTLNKSFGELYGAPAGSLPAYNTPDQLWRKVIEKAVSRDWTPTPANIELLPEPLRSYVLNLEAQLEEARLNIQGLIDEARIVASRVEEDPDA